MINSISSYIRCCLVAYLVLQCFNATAQQVLELTTGNRYEKPIAKNPTKEIIQQGLATEVTYQISEILLNDDPDFEGETLVKIEDFGVNSIETQPAFPLRTDCFAVPNGFRPSLAIKECAFKEYPMKLGPARMQSSDQDTHEYHAPKAVSAFSGFFPESFIHFLDSETYRGIEIQYVQVNPVLYDYSAGIIRVITKLTYSFDLKPSNEFQQKSNPKLNVFDDSFLTKTVLNPSVCTVTRDTTVSSIKDYLIITTSKYKEESERFANWKRVTGLNAIVISKDSWTPEQVKDSITSYANNHPDLYYLLLVGDNEDIPAHTVAPDLWNEDYYVSDFGYSCIDDYSEDSLADLCSARLPVNSRNQARIVFDKIIRFEKNPPIDSCYYNNGVHASHFQISEKSDVDYNYPPPESIYDKRTETRAFIQTSESIRDLMIDCGKDVRRIYSAETGAKPGYFNDKTPLPAELSYPQYSWNGNASDIISSINNGAFYILHRDHGSQTEWVHPHFSKSHIQELDNGYQIPVVFSINCATGKFDTAECFAEKFIHHENGGCVSILCAGGDSPTKTNEAFASAIFKNITTSHQLFLTHGNIELGEILNTAISSLIVGELAYNSETRYERNIFHWFGDPSMLFLMDAPVSFEDISIDVLNVPHVSVKSGNPKIVIYNKDSGTIDKFDANYVPLTDYVGSNFSICISDNDYRPVVVDCSDSKKLTIQCENVESSRSYTAKEILIGSKVTDAYPTGDVIFEKGNISLNGVLQLQKGVRINKGVIFKSTNQPK